MKKVIVGSVVLESDEHLEFDIIVRMPKHPQVRCVNHPTGVFDVDPTTTVETPRTGTRNLCDLFNNVGEGLTYSTEDNRFYHTATGEYFTGVPEVSLTDLITPIVILDPTEADLKMATRVAPVKPAATGRRPVGAVR